MRGRIGYSGFFCAFCALRPGPASRWHGICHYFGCCSSRCLCCSGCWWGRGYPTRPGQGGRVTPTLIQIRGGVGCTPSPQSATDTFPARLKPSLRVESPAGNLGLPGPPGMWRLRRPGAGGEGYPPGPAQGGRVTPTLIQRGGIPSPVRDWDFFCIVRAIVLRGNAFAPGLC